GRRLGELLELLESLDEDFLSRFLGLGMIAQPLPADGLDHPLEPAHEGAESFVVASLRGEHELGSAGEFKVEGCCFQFHGSLERFALRRSSKRARTQDQWQRNAG